jgi:GNAT superfamily N-acetyltransferase
MNSQDIIIRPYDARDRQEVRRICCDTAFMGDMLENFFDDREIFADFAISYYTDYEPQSLFVAENSGGIVGYIAGCCDTLRYKRILEGRILPKTILKILSRGLIVKLKTRVFLLNCLKSLMRGEFNRPVFLNEYPAHLHINITDNVRRLGVGFRLMDKLLEYFRENKITGVQLSSISKIGQSFFSKLNFAVLYSRRMTYFDYLVKEPVYLACFGKKL